MKMKKSSNQAGRSMMETIGYIGILILVTVSLTAAVNTGFNKFKLGRINQELVDLKKVISQRYVAAENYKEIDFDDLIINEKIVPYDVSDKKHAFGGSVDVGCDENDQADGQIFFIKFSQVPRAACMELGSRLWVVNDGSDLDSMNINGKWWGWKYSINKSLMSNHYELPAKTSEVVLACSKDENEMIWYFN